MSTSLDIVKAGKTKTGLSRPSLTLSDWGGIIVAIGMAAMTRAGYIEHKHEAEIHEHRNADREMMLYITAPSRQALRAMLANQPAMSQSVEALIQANLDLNTCLQEYKAHVDVLSANCGSYDQCLRRFSTTDEDDNVLFNDNSGLTGVSPSFGVESRPLLNIDINRGPVRYILSERSINLTILPGKVAQALRRHQADLGACRTRIVLVDQSLANLHRDGRVR